jgi:hypothetical protein
MEAVMHAMPSIGAARRCVAVLLVAAGAVCGGAAAEEGPAPATEVQDAAGLDARLAGLRPQVCSRDEVLCRHLKAFANAIPPCFRQGEQLSVGPAYIITADANVAPVEYISIRSQRVRDVTLVQSQHVYTENAEEKQSAEDLVQSIRADSIDPANGLYRYLDSRSAEVPELLAQKEGRTLVVRREGPTLYLRQAGKLLYVAVPDAIVGGTSQSDRIEGIVFAVLPAPASCQ